MEKICCDFCAEDYIQISPTGSSDIILDVIQDRKLARIRLSAAKIRKLRKQLKRALAKIEGVSDESP